MTTTIIQLFFPLLLVLVPLLYKRTGKVMTRFYWRMAASESARKFYVQVLVIALLLFHYAYVGNHLGEFGAVVSSVVCLLLFSYKRADRWLHTLHEERRTFYWVAVITIALGFVPHCYTVAITIAFLLLAAMFYPSYRVMADIKDEDTRQTWRDFPTLLCSDYY